MKRFTMFACLALALVFAFSSYASNLPRLVKADGNEVLVGGGHLYSKASRDTAIVIGPHGSGASVYGDFEDAAGNPSWNGWTGVDNTAPAVNHWKADTYYAITGTYAAWCGDAYPYCVTGDVDAGGYGNDYNDMLEWRGTVADNSLSCTVTVAYNIAYDVEDGWDFVYLQVETATAGFVDVTSYTSWISAPIADSQSYTYAAGEYMGANADEVVVLFLVTSDSNTSDQDCGWPGIGACQVDDVVITLSNGTGYSHDFEDGTLGDFTLRLPEGIGMYASLWAGLEDVDPCTANASAQVAFIDDGLVVPGTGGSPCVNWCYGPSGWIVNTTGGLLGGDYYMDNYIMSPVATWPDADMNGGILTFGVYRHEDLTADAPGMFYIWSVRSAGAGEDITFSPWADRNYVYYGGPDYIRAGDAGLADLLQAGRTQVQARLGVLEIGWIWGWTGNDGYPAPYFDNVQLKAFDIVGPGMSTRELELAQDNFPTIGYVDLANLGNNSVRFDAAQNIAPEADAWNDPGDSVTFNVSVARAGAALTGSPRMYYKIQANPAFDAYRDAGFTAEGYVLADSQRNASGTPVAGGWFADLPDSAFLFPGDIVHYYFWAEDAIGGADVQVATLPADTSGFSNFDPSNPIAYASSYTMRALPSVAADLTQPDVLFWNDFGNRGGQNEWHGALANLGMLAGRDYDIYYTQAPSSGVGNGLGGRATHFHLENYSTILYTAGDLSAFTMNNGDFANDPSYDVDVLTQWMDNSDGKLFATGDGLAYDLSENGFSTFMADKLGISFVTFDLRPLIDNQTAPRILPSAGQTVFNSVSSWIAYGGCAGINEFDAVATTGNGSRIAEFADVNGTPGGYPYAAAVENVATAGGSAIYMPYDLMFVYTDANEGAKAPAQLSARARILQDVLNWAGVATNPGDASGVPGAEKFAVRNFPNPFNPKTTISYTVAKPGHMTLKVFNVRGELVKTLIDGNVDVSSTIEWDGTNNAGGKVSSGVYFYEARMGADVVVNKMALVK